MSGRHDPQQKLFEKLAPHFRESESPCPYGLPHRAVYRAAAFHRIPEEIMGMLLAAGYRRNGNQVYAMRCRHCQACRPIRLPAQLFNPNRNQRRVARRNIEITTEIGPISPDSQKIALLQRFFDQRFPGRGNAATDYYAGFFLNSSNFSLEISYLLAGRLLGLGIIDVGTSWMNAVYYFFDPEESSRSMGTFNILQLVGLCREHDLEHLYLGYTIEGVRAMRYKTAFTPHQILVGSDWCNATPPRPSNPQ